MKRKTRTRIAYIGVVLGTVAAAFLCVLISRLLLDGEKRSLYNKPSYESMTIDSVSSIGAPLSLKTRLDLYGLCETEGEQRLPLPEELTESSARKIILTLWESTITELSGTDSLLVTGDSLSSLLSGVSVSAVLRDFTNEESGSRMSFWCVQAWFDSVSGETLCLSSLLDSRTGEPFYTAGAFFSAVNENTRHSGLVAQAQALGYSLNSAQGAVTEDSGESYTVTLSLGDGLYLLKTGYPGSQYTIELKAD